MNSIAKFRFWIHSYNILICVVCIYFGFKDESNTDLDSPSKKKNTDFDSLQHIHYDL